MTELSLFTGAGGGVLGTHGLLGWNCKGYVEFNEYCQRVIRQRIDDGILDEAPIFTDVREFVESGAARQYRGFIDVVSGGFPCQPFSVAGKQAGEDDSRNMWPATIEIIRAVQPRFAFLENVPGLLSVDGGRYFGRILGDLAESGYDARWRVLSAAEMGAPHKRDRLWIVAHTSGERARCESGTTGTDRGRRTRGDESALRQTHGTDGADRIESTGRATELGDSMREGLERDERAGGTRAEGWPIKNGQLAQSSKIQWWDEDPADETGTTKSELGRVAHGVANRVDRLKAIGNGQVPAVAAAAWNLLTEDFL